MPATTSSRRVLVTLPPPLDAEVEKRAKVAGLTVPAYLTSLAAKACKVKLDKPLARGGSRSRKKSQEISGNDSIER